MSPTTLQWVAALLFGLALIHSFSTRFFERLAETHPAHAGVWHLLGEIEVVFGLWAMILVIAMAALEGTAAATAYVDSRNFTEPLFVFAIMVIAGTRPILEFAATLVRWLARLLPIHGNIAFFLVTLSLVPMLGSLMTEPAAMTLAALILRDRYFDAGLSRKLMYATLGTLFVNVSIGGTLTPFAAPPVLMVAAKWNWDVAFMISTFGWKAALAVVFNAVMVTVFFRSQLRALKLSEPKAVGKPVPPALVVAHLAFLFGVVVFAHHPAIFMGLFLFFLGLSQAYQEYQDRLILREGLLVAFFLAGLVVLGAMQHWWLEPLLLGMSSDAVFYGATALTAITDNAALTYLGSLVDGLTPEFKYALVAGAVTGGGLTIIANAPNPAGATILKGYFEDQTIRPLGLLLAALPPTLVAIVAFRFL